MGAMKRHLRREARKAAMRLLKSGVPASQIGRFGEHERAKRFLNKVVDAAEKRIDTGEGAVSVREGLAALKGIQELEDRQLDLSQAEIPQEEIDASEAAISIDAASREAQADDAPGSQMRAGGKAAVGSPALRATG